jgi:SNF2 family DNA or RNA helicase
MEVRIEVVDGRIGAKSDRRFPGDVDMSKSVPGAKWNKEKRYWHYPLSLASCKNLRSVYSDMLVVGPQLSAWYRNETSKAQWMASFANQEDAALQRVPAIAPGIDAAMSTRPYQRVGARFIAMNRSILLADEPTLGKTIQYLGGLVEAEAEQGMHLIVAPKSSLKTTWANEILKWTDWHPFWMPEGKAKREKMLTLFLADEHPSKFLIVNPDMLQTKMGHWCEACQMWEPARKSGEKFPIEHIMENHLTKLRIQKQDWPQLFDVQWTSICVDEAHLSLLGMRPGASRTQVGEGLARLRTVPNPVLIASTGTPVKARPTNFFTVFQWLRPDKYTSKWAWSESFLKMKSNQFASSGKEILEEIRPEMEETFYDSIRDLMLRRTKAQVQPELPADLYMDHWVDLEGIHAEQYASIKDSGEVEMEGGSIATTGILAEFTRQKQFSFGSWGNNNGRLSPKTSPKFDWLLDQFARRGLTGDPKTAFIPEGGAHKYIIASQFTEIINWLEAQFAKAGIPCDKITGGVTQAKRDAVVERWQDDPDGPRVLLMNTMAGGTSLTLDAMCDEMFILDETWSRDDQIQVEGRIKNRNVEKRVATRTFHYVRTRGTIEEEIAESGLTQDEFQKTLLDRSRGMKIARREIQK